MDGDRWMETDGWRQMDGDRWMETDGWRQMDGDRWLDGDRWMETDGWRQMAGDRWLETDGWRQMDGDRWMETDGSLRFTLWVSRLQHETRHTGNTTSLTFVDGVLLFFVTYIPALPYMTNGWCYGYETTPWWRHNLAECLRRDILAAVQHNSSRALLGCSPELPSNVRTVVI